MSHIPAQLMTNSNMEPLNPPPHHHQMHIHTHPISIIFASFEDKSAFFFIYSPFPFSLTLPLSLPVDISPKAHQAFSQPAPRGFSCNERGRGREAEHEGGREAGAMDAITPPSDVTFTLLRFFGERYLLRWVGGGLVIVALCQVSNDAPFVLVQQHNCN